MFDELLGLTVDEASKKTTNTIRVMKKDGVEQALDCRYRKDRINVAVDGNVITEVICIG